MAGSTRRTLAEALAVSPAPCDIAREKSASYSTPFSNGCEGQCSIRFHLSCAVPHHVNTILGRIKCSVDGTTMPLGRAARRVI